MKTDRSIITAFTQNFWKDFLVCYDSIRRVYDGPFYVAPLDFDDEYREKLEALDVDIIEFSFPEIDQMKMVFEDRWVQWSKPYIIRRMIDVANKPKCLWLDVDLVVLKSLDPLFEEIDKDFLVINDYFAPKACLNDEELYTYHPAPIPECQKEVSINSGVVGIKMPRDNYILDQWLVNTKKVEDNQNLMKYIRLYDQGVLLWTMRELKIIDKSQPYSLWNHQAKRNCYEYCTKSMMENEPNFRWPVPKIPRMGGDIIDEVKVDNPGVTIAHFAGIPKLSNLCEVNHPRTVRHAQLKFQGHSRARVFCVGMERCGTHTISEMFRRSVMHESWIRHEFAPVLAKEVELKWNGQKYWTGALTERMKLYNRQDAFVVSETNHRLGFLIPEIASEVKDSKFLMMLRSPVDLLLSRMRNYSIWARDIGKLPQIYLNGLEAVGKTFEHGSGDQNIFRIKPRDTPDFADWPLAKKHCWEVLTTMRQILTDLKKLPNDRYSIIWIEGLESFTNEIDKLMPGRISWPVARKWMGTRFGSSLKPSGEIEDWIQQQIEPEISWYVDEFIGLMRDFDVTSPHTAYI